MNRFSGGFGPNARIGFGLFASDRFRPDGFEGGAGGGGGGGFGPSPFQFGQGPFRSVPNPRLATWSNLPFGFF